MRVVSHILLRYGRREAAHSGLVLRTAITPPVWRGASLACEAHLRHLQLLEDLRRAVLAVNFCRGDARAIPQKHASACMAAVRAQVIIALACCRLPVVASKHTAAQYYRPSSSPRNAVEWRYE